MFKNAKLVLILGTLLFSIPVFACRPLATDDCPTVEPGKWEIESGFTSNTPKGGSASNSLGIQIKTGILDKADFSVELPYRLSDTAGLQDIILHGKYRIMGKEDEGLSFRTDIKLSNGDTAKSLGSGYTDVSLFLLNSMKINQIPVHMNVMYSIVGVATGAANANFWQASVAGEYAIHSKLTGVSELTWNNSNTSTNPVTLLIGSYYELSELMTVDAGYTLGLTESAPSRIFTVGATVHL